MKFQHQKTKQKSLDSLFKLIMRCDLSHSLWLFSFTLPMSRSCEGRTRELLFAFNIQIVNADCYLLQGRFLVLKVVLERPSPLGEDRSCGCSPGLAPILSLHPSNFPTSHLLMAVNKKDLYSHTPVPSASHSVSQLYLVPSLCRLH